MKFAIIGTSEFTITCAKAVLDSDQEVCAFISMPRNVLPLNPADTSSFASSNNISHHEIEDINSQESIDIIKKCNPDYILSSWPKIISKKLLEIPRFFCIGSHPTDLPYNRGRHPLHWLIALGIFESKLSFFVMDEGVDTGSVLLQITFTLSPHDNIQDANSKVNEVAYEGVKTLCNEILNSETKPKVQDESKANYWRGRTINDTILDLRMNSDIISRIVRSFNVPYPCAKLIFKNNIIPIISTSVSDTNLTDEELKRIEPGKIISKLGKRIKVKVDNAIIELESKDELPAELLKAKYIHPPSKYISEWPKDLMSKLL